MDIKTYGQYYAHVLNAFRATMKGLIYLLENGEITEAEFGKLAYQNFKKLDERTDEFVKMKWKKTTTQAQKKEQLLELVNANRL